jgi:hypothetical protein
VDGMARHSVAVDKASAALRSMSRSDINFSLWSFS